MNVEQQLGPENFALRLPHSVFDLLRTNAPVSQIELPDGVRAWNLVRYVDVSDGLRNLHVFATPSVDVDMTAPPDADRWAVNGMMVLAPPEHTDYRRVFAPAFRREAIEKYRALCGSIARRHIAATPKHVPADLLEGCLGPVAAAMACGYLGIADNHVDYYRRLSAVFMGDTLPPGDIGVEKGAALGPRALAASHGSAAHALTELIAESWTVQPWLPAEFVESADRWQLEDLGMQFVTAGTGGLRNALAAGVVALADSWGSVSSQVRIGELDVSTIAEEVLRIASPLLRVRRILADDVTLHGQKMARGDTVLLWLVAANYDPAQFSEPQRFDPSRSPNAHLSFGGGVHHCLGARLASIQVAEFLRAAFNEWHELRLTRPVQRFPSNVVNEFSQIGAEVG